MGPGLLLGSLLLRRTCIYWSPVPSFPCAQCTRPGAGLQTGLKVNARLSLPRQGQLPSRNSAGLQTYHSSTAHFQERRRTEVWSFVLEWLPSDRQLTICTPPNGSTVGTGGQVEHAWHLDVTAHWAKFSDYTPLSLLQGSLMTSDPGFWQPYTRALQKGVQRCLAILNGHALWYRSS